MHKNIKICIVGLGYVGLPLAVAFGKKQSVNGFDINKKRIRELKNNIDITEETSTEELKNTKVNFSSNPEIIKESNFIIVAVPTPVDNKFNPDITILLNASKLVGENLKEGSIVVYESTVYPGCTETDCIPILEKYSGLKFKEDFQIGYSPERINPGDKIHTIDKIVKIVSGSNEETLNKVANIYEQIITAGVYKASSIQVAEAAKIIENTQRDVNIALMNEFKMIFDKANIDCDAVLEAAGTKWNFLKFIPGLVGGHCIGVDPYYLAKKAKELNHNPKMILSGRQVNNDMARYEATRIIDFMKKNNISSTILLLGATFKPNITDIRNSKVEDLIIELKQNDYRVDVYDPFIKDTEIFGCKNIVKNNIKKYNFIVKTVNHDIFKDIQHHYEILKYKNDK